MANSYTFILFASNSSEVQPRSTEAPIFAICSKRRDGKMMSHIVYASSSLLGVLLPVFILIGSRLIQSGNVCSFKT